MWQDRLYYTESPDGELAFAKAPTKAEAIKVFQACGVQVMSCTQVWLVFDKAGMAKKRKRISVQK